MQVGDGYEQDALILSLKRLFLTPFKAPRINIRAQLNGTYVLT